MSRKLSLCALKEGVHVVEEQVFLGPHPLQHVWVQGSVTNILHDIREFYLDDGTEQMMVTCPNVNVRLEGLVKGDYVMVQGSVVVGEDSDTGETIVLLDARLVNKLTDPSLPALWAMEVQEVMDMQKT